jgi:radical SAM-linked protein
MLRRASLPFALTQGYNPKPRLVFALSLGLGIIGHDEVVDLELTEQLPIEEIARRLREQCPAGLAILHIEYVDHRSRPRVRMVRYRLSIPREETAALVARASSLMAARECRVRRSRPQPRDVDIRPYLISIHLDLDNLQLELRVTPGGTARPDEILVALGASDLVRSGAVWERTALVLEEVTAGNERVPKQCCTGAAIVAEHVL